MAGLFTDSFDHYANADVLRKWSSMPDAGNNNPSPNHIIASAGRRSTSSFRLRSNQINAHRTRAFQVTFGHRGPVMTGNTLFIAVAMRFNETLTNVDGTVRNGEGAFSIVDGTLFQVYARLNQDGTLSFYRGGTTTSPLLTTTAAISSVYSHWQVKLVIDASAGEIHVRYNGGSAQSATGLATRHASSVLNGATGFRLGPIAGLNSNRAVEMDYDDLVLFDGSSPIPNDWVGDAAVDADFVTTEGNYTDSTPSTGSNRALTVDETQANGDTDYNTLAAAGNADTFGFGTFGTPGATVHLVQLSHWARKADAGVATLANRARVGGSDYDATALTVGTDYEALRFLYGASPTDGTTSLETSELNATEHGPVKVS